MVPNATIFPVPGGQQSTTGINNTDGSYIIPTTLPPVSNAAGNQLTTLSNQLAGQQIKLFQDLFPVTKDYNFEVDGFSNLAAYNQDNLINDIVAIKMTVLSLNQIVTAPSRLPAGLVLGTGGSNNPALQAGLITNQLGLNNNVMLQINNVYQDIINGDYPQAQSDYCLLRDNLLVPFYGL